MGWGEVMYAKEMCMESAKSNQVMSALNEQQKLIFVHIPKTAGTTLTDYLLESVPAERVFHGRTMLDYQQLDQFALEDYQLLKGHVFFHYIEQHLSQDQYALLTVLRNPVERVISLYRYWRSQAAGFLQNESIPEVIRGRVRLAKSLSLHDFVHSEQPMVVNSIANSQARQLSSAAVFENFHQQPIDVIVDDVLKNLQQFAVVGISELLAQFYLEMHQVLGFSLPQHVQYRNVSEQSEQLWRTSREHRAIIERIRAVNRADMELYAELRFQKMTMLNQYVTDNW
jgi:hypothetical protein